MSWDDITDKFSSVGEGFGRFAKRLFGSENEREIRRLTPVIAEINGLESWAEGLDRETVQAEVAAMRAKVQSGDATLEECLTKMFALTREASQRTLGMRHYDVQLVGGYVLHQGKIAEMMTGEGKTLMATLALALNALAGRPCFLVTVNDYLARRDAEWMRPIYEYLGLSVGSIQSSLDAYSRQPVYACDIIYATNNELGFDYLRDNMKTTLGEQVQKDLYFAIVDEVDSILIDEARTPLIISGPAEDHVGRYKEADEVARKLEAEVDYEVKEKERQASLTEDGIVKAQELLGVESFYVPGFEDWPHYIENALRAHSLYELDKEYVVEDAEDPRTGQVRKEVVIVDEFTGRKMAGRRWSDGLHQAVEVKEGIEPKEETQTLATITFQNYFRMYDKLAGMTGTALTEAGEFHKIYELDVISVPTNKPIARDDHVDTVYRTLPEKWDAICDEIERVHDTGQPILVGTASVENSEHLSGLLRERHVPHEVLNAKNHEREAQIVALAGQKGSITVSTNMAGRGTDIKLGGNFEALLEGALEEAGLEAGDLDRLDEIDSIRERVRQESEAAEAEVLGLGGLYVLGTERHEARRIDNQLRGRTGRQGDVGASRFFLSLQDPLMRIFYRDWVVNAMERLGMSEGQPIESGMVARQVARAQKKVEDRNFEIRKNLLEYDEVMDHQRTEIYAARQAVLEGENLKDRVDIMISNVVDRASDTYSGDPAGFAEWAHRTFDVALAEDAAAAAVDADAPDLGPALDAIDAVYTERRGTWGDELTARIESYLVLTAIDQKWKDHLHAMDALKAGIGLRGYGQQDPKIAYKKEATELFNEQLLPAIEGDITSKILRIDVQGDGDAQSGQRLAPRSIASGAREGAPAAEQRPRFDQLSLEQQKAIVAQLPEEQKVLAVLQSGGNDEALLEELGDEYRAQYEETKVKFEEQRAAAANRPQKRFDEATFEEQQAFIAQVPEDQKLLAVFQSGEHEEAHLADLGDAFRARYEEAKPQLEEQRAAAANRPQKRFDELSLDDQKALIAQLPDDQKLIAVFQSGEHEEAHLAELGDDFRARYAEAKPGFEEQRAAAANRPQKRFDELSLEEQVSVMEQLPEDQKLVAVYQSGREDELLAALGGDYAERYPEAKERFDEQRRAAEAQRAAQMRMQRGPAASSAFDVMKRQSQAKPAGEAAQAASAPKRDAGSRTATKDAGSEFQGAGRNDPCPCGSGKKYKKCHGR